MPMRFSSTRLILSMLCAGIASVAQASTHFIFVAQTDSVPVVPAWRFDHHQAEPDSPEHWAEMSAQERAELWPLLEPRMQRFYWTSMTRAERLAMREHLSRRHEYSIRHRYTSPPDSPEFDSRKPPSHRLSPEERARMRQQIREMHVEYYEFRHHRPRHEVDRMPGVAPEGVAPSAPVPGQGPDATLAIPPAPHPVP